VSSAVATDLCRVVLVTPTSSAELAMPARVTVGDLLPPLVSHSGAAEEGTPEYEQGWVLQRLGQAPFDEEGTPTSLGIREGETLYLRPAGTRIPATHFDDLIDGVATGVGERPDRWGATATRWAFRALCGGLLLLGLWLSWSGPLAVRAAVGGLVTVLLLLGAAASSRALADRPTALLFALAALPYAGVTGLVVPMLSGGAVFTAASVLCAMVAMALTALLAIAALGTDEVLFAAIAVASTGGIVGGALGVLGLPGPQAAAIVLGLTLVISVFAPTTAFKLAGLRLPMLPTGAEDLNKNIDPIPGPRLLASG
jgi:type VII secretion integral membrane protein EccD